ncbi:hypothetical protein DI270_016110 [Microbispora triticiradicis]|uniref:Uncharacterized protein n=1 Tax=Microbispora triticiradicis TaxID=2200763 RepID=A0ABX9LJ21_9ACTN|nr:hypothetical protein [Microbispora triticiradicis]RGA03971.1 hypothetical protein DI270_016110 [Microbispora triticiradicis]GLW24957.1 hypothetical protein Mame01_49990 [Microbispora amethystogenes]
MRVDSNEDLLEYGDGAVTGMSPHAKDVGVSRHGRFAAWREGRTGWLLDARTRAAVRLPGGATDQMSFSDAGYLQWRTAGGYDVLDLATLDHRC